MEGPVVFRLGGVPVESFQQRDGKLGSVAPVVERIPFLRLSRSRGNPLGISGKILVVRIRHFEVAGKVIENAGHIGGALNIGVTAQGVNSTARPANIAQEQLDHGSGANDLGAVGMLRPPHGVNNGTDFFGVAFIPNRGEDVGGFQELVFVRPGDLGDIFRRVLRVLLFEQLIDTPGMLE